jgi:hydroxymethylglutaryl-CoA lyase
MGVEIVEVSPRDGLQSEEVLLTLDAKIELITRLARAGLTLFEIGSFVNPKLVPAMADSAMVFEGTRDLSIHQIALALNSRGVLDALAAKADEIRYVVPVTDTFAQRNQGSTTFSVIEGWNETIAQTNQAGVVSTIVLAVSFGCPFEGEVPTSRILECIDHFAVMPHRIVLADTIGVATPGYVSNLFNLVVGEVGQQIKLGGHFHDTRGTALANVMAALEVGVTQFDSSIGGAGGCPFAPGSAGNLATEDLIYMLQRDSFCGDIDLEQLIETGRWLESQLRRDLPGHVHRSGSFPKLAAIGSTRAPRT